MTTVGPYLRYGSKLVAACAAAGVHCCDLTGESLWVKDMIDKHEEEAERTGAKIVPSCGFDSIPAVRQTVAYRKFNLIGRLDKGVVSINIQSRDQRLLKKCLL